MDDFNIILPERDELHRRLLSVVDEPHIVSKLYPKIEEHAGRAFPVLGFVMMWTLAVSDYTRDLPPQMAMIQDVAVHLYARALIDDPEALQQTLTYLGAMGLPTGE
jgi:hypothetical protein